MIRIIYLSVALWTFLCGCALAWLFSGHTKKIAANEIPPVQDVELVSDRKSLLDGIEETVRGCGNGYGQGYELPDGKKLGEGNTCYSSFQEANDEMRIWLKKSENIIDRLAPAAPADGPKSERVVASFPVDEFGNKWVTIFWVQGHCIHWISAPDLKYALELEKSKYNPYKFDE